MTRGLERFNSSVIRLSGLLEWLAASLALQSLLGEDAPRDAHVDRSAPMCVPRIFTEGEGRMSSQGLGVRCRVSRKESFDGGFQLTHALGSTAYA